MEIVGLIKFNFHGSTSCRSIFSKLVCMDVSEWINVVVSLSWVASKCFALSNIIMATGWKPSRSQGLFNCRDLIEYFRETSINYLSIFGRPKLGRIIFYFTSKTFGRERESENILNLNKFVILLKESFYRGVNRFLRHSRTEGI